MKNIDRIKLSREIYDTILHRECVLRSGKYLATYLEKNGEKDLVHSLIDKCLVHDISKLEDTREFAALASINDQLEQMKNISHTLTDNQKKMIALHWANKLNDHHPEHFPSPNDMQHLNILEMSCDLHSRSKQWHTDPLEYLRVQQDAKYHFDKAHYTDLSDSLKVLEEATAEDKYLDIFNTDIDFLFTTRDPVVAHLENFSDICYVSKIETERLLLVKSMKSDYSSIIYMIKQKDTGKTIGDITIFCNGKIYYKIPRKYSDLNYVREVLLKFKDIIKRKEFSFEVSNTNILAQQVADELGFVSDEESLEGIRTYKFIKS